MHTLGRDILTALFLGLVVPGVLLELAAVGLSPEVTPPETTVQTTAATLPRESVLVPVRWGETVADQPLEDYLVGVVLGEMPASFEPEALKAQAVAARTYTRKAMATGGNHGDGSVCRDPGCCQAYIDPERYLTQGGTAAALEKIRSAVADTRGYVLTWEGELIEATYFSCSGGTTESAAAVWGTDYPYLQAVASPGETAATHYQDEVTFSSGEFQSLLGRSITGSPETWFQAVTYTQGGGVDTMTIGGQIYTGPELRRLLGLNSTAMAIRVENDAIVITTQGYGHRVGLSQYGADAMAVTGSDFVAILSHYYPGTTLEILPEDG